ncbi:hypothetical protein JW868_02290 [Candidatus Woesearchaeota archaeon]|nr:hypothetical protein [Candidatus Woesearchaeota archaeon]
MHSRAIEAIFILFLVSLVSAEFMLNTEIFASDASTAGTSVQAGNVITGAVIGNDGTANEVVGITIAFLIFALGAFLLYRSKSQDVYVTKNRYERYLGLVLRMTLGVLVLMSGLFIIQGLENIMISALYISSGLFLMLGFHTRVFSLLSIFLSARLLMLGAGHWAFALIFVLAGVLAWFGAGLPSIDSAVAQAETEE